MQRFSARRCNVKKVDILHFYFAGGECGDPIKNLLQKDLQGIFLNLSVESDRNSQAVKVAV
jgi:hypothetical protein